MRPLFFYLSEPLMSFDHRVSHETHTLSDDKYFKKGIFSTWIGRKVAAFSLAMYSGIFLTIKHLACAVFNKNPNMYLKKSLKDVRRSFEYLSMVVNEQKRKEATVNRQKTEEKKQESKTKSQPKKEVSDPKRCKEYLISEKYLSEGKLEEAFDSIQDIFSEIEAKEELLVRLAKLYCEKESVKEAYNVLKEVAGDIESRDQVFEQLVVIAKKRKQTEYIRKICFDVAFETLNGIVEKVNNPEKYYLLYESFLSNSQPNNFKSQLTDECYEKAINLIDQENPSQAFIVLRDYASSKEVVDRYMNSCF